MDNRTSEIVKALKWLAKETEFIFAAEQLNDAAALIEQQEAELAALKEARPLTLEELRQMDGTNWVWLDNDTNKHNRGWARVHRMYNCVRLEVLDYDFRDYGKTWLAYTNKPAAPEEQKGE